MTTQYDLFSEQISVREPTQDKAVDHVVAPAEPQVDLFAFEEVSAQNEPVPSIEQPQDNLNPTPDAHEIEHQRKIAQQFDRLQAAKEHSKKFLLPDVNINEAFSALVILRVEQYLADLEGVEGLPTYDMIVSAAERPLLQWAMDKAGGKQLAAAKILGINRNTLRKKLRMHGFLDGDFE